MPPLHAVVIPHISSYITSPLRDPELSRGKWVLINMATSAVTGSAQIELSISCRKLKDMDLFSKSDPFVVLKSIDTQTSSWREIDRTEVIE